ncbi:MAG TPA: GNAT family N-acetyltransferase [Nocardioides sp.]|uniref:GNAT family N-acetyltransferase n=1 Tax=Nocardioides sp. TaxID=35761 RepID=UPI002CABB34E|nr:GNAT family N-acetyltransferase [Nocardioides sp.]HTW15384.1 GNAT family N-acetyltransferase [Nocardioides sp.]
MNRRVDRPADRLVVMETPRLVLTTWKSDDVDSLVEMHSDPESMRHVRYGRPETRTEVEDLVQAYMEAQTLRGWTKWRLADHDGELLGRAGFGGDDDVRGIAYAIRRSHWGRGLATEIAEALVRWHLVNAPGLRLRGVVAVGNDASARVLEKTGFEEVGTGDFQGTLCREFVHPRSESRSDGIAENLTAAIRPTPGM